MLERVSEGALSQTARLVQALAPKNELKTEMLVQTAAWATKLGGQYLLLVSHVPCAFMCDGLAYLSPATFKKPAQNIQLAIQVAVGKPKAGYVHKIEESSGSLYKAARFLEFVMSRVAEDTSLLVEPGSGSAKM